MVRAQYELDDIAEAEIICKGYRGQEDKSQERQEHELISESQTADITDQARQSNFYPSKILTWRLPAWVNFSYSTMQQRGHHPQHRRPNPFGPHRDTDLTQPHANTSPEKMSNPPSPQEGPSSTTKVTPDGYPWHMPATQPKRDPAVLNMNIDTNALQATGPVTSYPPPDPWDDQDLLDLPYDNPFYTRTIDNVLWLPKNPSCILNLDDTVNMKVSLTVEKSAGRLGTWLGLGETASPEELSSKSDVDLSPPPNTMESPSVPSITLPVAEVDGTEEIDLPLVIAKRVKAGERDVEHTLQPRKSSIFGRKASGGDPGSIGPISTAGRRRPSILDRTTHPAFRSVSDSVSATRARSASIMSTLQVPPPSERVRSSELDQELGVRPDAHAQADFVAANSSASRISLTAPTAKLSRSQNLSAAQAIFHEVLEEERQALRDRIEEEHAEAAQSQNKKSWLTSWMYWKTE